MMTMMNPSPAHCVKMYTEIYPNMPKGANQGHRCGLRENGDVKLQRFEVEK